MGPTEMMDEDEDDEEGDGPGKKLWLGDLCLYQGEYDPEDM
jgi:hypothetical protein